MYIPRADDAACAMKRSLDGGSTEKLWGVSKNGPAEGVIKRQKRNVGEAILGMSAADLVARQEALRVRYLNGLSTIRVVS
jgi:hypothetical protein